MAELSLAMKKDSLWRKLESGERDQEDAQEAVSIHCQEFLEEVILHVTTAIKKVISLENAESHPPEEVDHQQKVPMAGASSAMRKVTKKLIVLIEEIDTGRDLVLQVQGATREKDRDLDLILQKVREGK